MDQAVEQARQGNVEYFQQLSPDTLGRLQQSKDEDGRSLLHAAAASGSLPLCELLHDKGGQASVNQQDDEVRLPRGRSAPCPTHYKSSPFILRL